MRTCVFTASAGGSRFQPGIFPRRTRASGLASLTQGPTLNRIVIATPKWKRLIMMRGRLVRKPGFAPGPSPSQGEMLLLHHNPDGAPGRTCTDEYEFTKL